ncbi:MAG: alpha/beta hydrolase family protein [Anaerolineae bacterium]
MTSTLHGHRQEVSNRASDSPELSFAFRFQRYLSHPTIINLGLRLLSAARIPIDTYARFSFAGLPYEEVHAILTRIRSLAAWPEEWAKAAREDYKRAEEALTVGRATTACQLFLQAALKYHYAEFILYDRLEYKQELVQLCARAYQRAAPLFDPPARRVTISFREVELPGYLRVPWEASRPPCVIVVNGGNSVKEELHVWAEGLLQRELAVLYIDGPGGGEVWPQMKLIVEQEEVAGAVIDWLARDGTVDSERVGLCGMSLGGWKVLRMAAFEPRVRACASISAPYDPRPYYRYFPALIQSEILYAAGFPDQAEINRLLEAATLRGVVERVRCPTLVVGAGRDMLVPGSEARRIYQALPGPKDFLFYPNDSHVCFEHFSEMAYRVWDWMVGQLADQGGDQ